MEPEPRGCITPNSPAQGSPVPHQKPVIGMRTVSHSALPAELPGSALPLGLPHTWNFQLPKLQLCEEVSVPRGWVRAAPRGILRALLPPSPWALLAPAKPINHGGSSSNPQRRC